MKEVLQVLESALALAPPRVAKDYFRVEWDEPANGLSGDAIKELEDEYLSDLPEKKRVYYQASMSRFRFVSAAAVRYFAPGGRILDVGCAPGFASMVLHKLGFAVHGIDLNTEWEATYPDRKWLETLHVQALDVEKQALPFADNWFDGIVFTEVLEHIAFANPRTILREFRRVMKPGAAMLLTTPNVCNLANIVTLAKGKNIFWAPELFYGGSDRHNREYTPNEVVALIEESGFDIIEKFLFNGPNNWNGAAIESMYEILQSVKGLDCSLLGNTIFLAARRPGQNENV